MVINIEAINAQNRNRPEDNVSLDKPSGFLMDPTPGVFTQQKSLQELSSLLSTDPTVKRVQSIGRRGSKGLVVLQALPERKVASTQAGGVIIETHLDSLGRKTDIMVSRNTGVPYSHTNYEYVDPDAALRAQGENPTQRWVLTDEITTVKKSLLSRKSFQASRAHYDYGEDGTVIPHIQEGNPILSLVFNNLSPQEGQEFTANVDDIVRQVEKAGRPDVSVIKEKDGTIIVRAFSMGKGNFAAGLHLAMQNDYVIRNGRTEAIRIYKGYAGESEFSYAYARDGRFSDKELTYKYDDKNVCISEESKELQSGVFVPAS